MEQTVIRVEHIAKDYKLYDKKSDRLKETLSLTRKQYHRPFHALKDITFDAKKGEVVGIIGTNGSGKSTLLKILTGVATPTNGSYEVQGKVSALLELGAGFNSEYTGLQNIDLNGTMMGYTPEEMVSRREEIIKFADIGDYIDQPVKNYSSGMFARLAFAVAISVEPDVLIVDEALSVGDVFFQSKCFRKFDELKKKGTTILFVSHDIGAVRELCERVLWIEHGEQQMFGPSNDVCTAYFNSQMSRMNKENARVLEELKAGELSISNHKNKRLACPAITPASNSVFSEKVEILSTYVQDADGNYTKDIIAGNPYSIGVVTKFKEPLDKVIIGFSMSNAKGIIYLSENTYNDTGKNFSVSAGDIIESSFRFVAPKLRSGQYEISPAVALGVQDSHVNLTWLHGALSVEYETPGYEIAEIGLDYDIQNEYVNDVQLIQLGE